MTPPAPDAVSPDAIAREQVVSSLTPFFLDAARGNQDHARAAADAMLNGYGAQTTEDIQLAAQIIAFGFAALDSLCRSAAEPDLPVNIQLRLRGNANAMNRAAQQCRRALQLRRKAGATPQSAGAPSQDAASPEPRTFTEADVAAAMKKASEVIAYARSDLKSGKPTTYTQRMHERERLKRLAKRQAAALANAATNPTAEAFTPATV
jgi:hypothetical protein